MKHPALLDTERAIVARDWDDGIIVDNFAGGGGASTGIEAALGCTIDVAINHDREAVAMHAANHPRTRHHCQSVWSIDPLDAVTIDGVARPVRLAWFSPDCKHFSKAKGGKPVEKNIRDLAWVVHHWIDRLGPALRPAVIMLENVEEFRTWGPLAPDGRPCRERRGQTFDQWVRKLRRAGYKVEWRELRACDYGAPTSRKRLFLIARCDGRPIVWPKRTHAPADHPDVLSGKLLPWRTAAECIDWKIPCPSIFTRKRPLKDATCRRIAAGTMRYVVNAARPFIVPVTHTSNGATAHSADDPLRTITTAKGGELAVVSPTLIQTGYGERKGQTPRVPGLDKPLGTVVAGGAKHALVTAFLEKFSQNSRGRPADAPLDTVMAGAPRHGIIVAHMAQHNAGNGAAPKPMTAPLSTITGRGTQQQLVTSHMVKLRNNQSGQSVEEPIGTLTSGGGHYGEVRAFLVKYYGNEQDGHSLDSPIGTIPTRDRFGLVTVTIDGELYAIADIGMRMLTPRELYNAQGFPPDYIIELAIEGRPLTKTAQVRMCGNSVSPVMSEALARANLPGNDAAEKVAA